MDKRFTIRSLHVLVCSNYATALYNKVIRWKEDSTNTNINKGSTKIHAPHCVCIIYMYIYLYNITFEKLKLIVIV